MTTKRKRRKLVKAMRKAVERLNAGQNPGAAAIALLTGLVYYAELREHLKK
jgi:hypothetical protein